MLDIVLAENLQKPAGIGYAANAMKLGNFRQPKGPEEARILCKAKGVLLYAPSYEFDDGVYMDLAKSGSALVFSFSDILHNDGYRRAIALSKMRLALAACRNAGCGFVVCTLAKKEGEERTGRELAAFMSVLGMDQHEKKASELLLGKLAAAKM